MTARPKDAAWVLRMGRHGVQVLAVVGVLALVFTMVNVQQFAAQGHPMFGVQWWIAWLLDPMASLTMAAAIVFEGLPADYGKPKVHWLTATKWYAGVATWGMNIWASAATGSLAGVWLHSVAPGLVLGLAEAAPRVRRHMAEIITEFERDTQHGTQKATSASCAATPTTPTPSASDPAPAVPQMSQPAGTLADDELVTRVRKLLAASNGQAPGRRAVAKQLGITEHQARAALVAATTGPALNGTGGRSEHTTSGRGAR